MTEEPSPYEACKSKRPLLSGLGGPDDYLDLRAKSAPRKGNRLLSKEEFERELRVLIEVKMHSIPTAAKLLGQPLTTVRRICRTLGISSYAKVDRNGRKSRSSQVPYGWINVGGHLHPNRTEVRWIQYMRKLRSEGMSYTAIGSRLNALRVPTKNGRQWHARTIWKILKSAK